MKKALRILSLSLLLCIAVLSLFSCKSDNKDAEEGTDYVFNSNNYSLFIPEDWTVTLASDSLSASAPDGSSVTIAPFDYSTSEYITIDTVWEKICENFETFFNGKYSVVNTDNENDRFTTIGGLDAGKYIYTGSVGGVDMKFENVITIYDSRVFLMVFSSTAELFDSHKDDFDGIVAKFEFNKTDKTYDGYKLVREAEKKLYDSGKFKVSIDRDWITDTSTGVLSAKYANGFPSCITFMTADLGEFTDLHEYWYSYKETFEKSMKGFTILEDDLYHDKEDEIFGLPARQFVFTAIPAVDSSNQETVYKYCQVLIKNGNEVIIATYSSSANTDKINGYYDTHFEIFRDALDSLTIVSE